MKREFAIKSLIGALTYVVSMVEAIYAWLQLLNGNGDYYDLGRLIMESLGMAGINVRHLGQGLVLGPMVMSGYLPIFIALLIMINNALIATYIYRLGRARELGTTPIIAVVTASVVNASLIALTTDPWTPQVIATSLAIATYYYIDNDNRHISTALAALTAFLSPITNLLNILVPITHWSIKREFNESSQYVLTIGLIAFTYYWLAGAYSIMHVLSVQGVINQVIYLLSTTSFIQLATLGTAIPALIGTVLGGVGFTAIVPAILAITLVEAVGRLREGRLAVLVLAVAVIITVLTTPISPMWPPYQETGSIGMNWQPLSGDYVMIYSLASLSPKGYIENTLAPTYALMVMKPGRHVMGYVTPAEPTNGTYAICGKYQLVLRNYMGLTVINSYEREIAQFITNATSYTEDNALTIPGGLYQERILVSTGELTIPPGTYVITTTVDITPVSAFVNTTIPQVMSTPLTSSVLPISAGSVITFNLSLSFTGTINQVIIYGAAYTEQPATLSLAILRNGQVMTRASAEAPPITQGMGPHPITFNVNLNVTPGTYQVSIATDQPLIVYITSGTGMSVTSGNMTINYPGNVPTYTITYTVIKAVPIRTTQLTITLTTMNETTSMNITRGGTYELTTTVTTNHWVNTSINLLITTNEPVLPTNVTVGPITIKPLGKTQCPTPALIKALEDPGRALLIGLTATPIAAALPLASRVRPGRRVRKALLALGIALMLLFYIAWALGFTNISPQLYNPQVLRVLGILFIMGLVITVTTALIKG